MFSLESLPVLPSLELTFAASNSAIFPKSDSVCGEFAHLKLPLCKCSWLSGPTVALTFSGVNRFFCLRIAMHSI